MVKGGLFARTGIYPPMRRCLWSPRHRARRRAARRSRLGVNWRQDDKHLHIQHLSRFPSDIHQPFEQPLPPRQRAGPVLTETDVCRAAAPLILL